METPMETDAPATRSAEEYKDMGNNKYKEGKYREAVALYSKAIELDGGKTPAYFGNRAAAYVMLGNSQSAAEDCEQAVQVDPQFQKGYARAAKCYLQLGKLEKAKKHNQEILRLDPKNTTALEDLKTIQRVEKEIELAKNDLENKEYHKALAHVEIATNFCSESDAIKLLKAKTLCGLKKYPDVLNIINEVMRNDPNNSEAVFVRGIALFYTANIPNAIKHFKQALQSDPDNPDYRKYLRRAQLLENRKKDGNDAFSSGKYQEAYDIYTECLNVDAENDTTNATLYCNRAAAAMKLQKFQDAVSDCSKTIELDPQYLKAYLRRAACYTSLEKYDDAVRDYDKAHQLDPESADIARSLREAKLEQKKASRKDYYKILGVSKNADDNEIKKAYKKGALTWHPDKHSGSEEAKQKADIMFKDIGEAYAVLSDPNKRRKYDSGEDLQEMEGGMADVDVSQIFSMFFGGGGPGGGGGFSFGGMPPGGMPRGGSRSRRSGGMPSGFGGYYG